MSCKSEWENTANELEAAAKVGKGQADGALRCNHAGCDKMVLRDKGVCLAGHAQDGAAGEPLAAKLGDALLCLAEQIEWDGPEPALVAEQDARIQEAQAILRQPQQRGRHAEKAVALLVDAIGGLNVPAWNDDPRMRTARAFLAEQPAPAAGLAGSSVLDTYIAGKSAKPYKPMADMEERWATRMVPNGWPEQGEAGARAYLERYGRGIKPDKCVHLARHAEHMGCPEVARGFWKKAYELETGQALPD